MYILGVKGNAFQWRFSQVRRPHGCMKKYGNASSELYGALVIGLTVFGDQSCMTHLQEYEAEQQYYIQIIQKTIHLLFGYRILDSICIFRSML